MVDKRLRSSQSFYLSPLVFAYLLGVCQRFCNKLTMSKAWDKASSVDCDLPSGGTCYRLAKWTRHVAYVLERNHHGLSQYCAEFFLDL